MQRYFLAAGLALTLGVAFSPARAQTDKKPPIDKKAPVEDAEVALGRKTHAEMIKGGLKLLADPVLLTRVEAIGKKLAEIVNKTEIAATYGSVNKTPFSYQFFVVDDKDINAFSIPGGYIYINSGLLKSAQSDDELAGVIGHEIMHAAHHHVSKLQKEQGKLDLQLALGALAAIITKVPTNDLGNLLTGVQLVAIQKINGFSQAAEFDADYGGVILAEKGGYNPVGALTFMERLGREQKKHPDVDYGIYRTHPPEKLRANAMIDQITAMGKPINRRETSNILKVTTRVAGPISEVLVDERVFLKTPSAEKARQTAQLLDKMLGEDLQIYDIRQKGASVSAREQELVLIDSEDAKAAGTASPEAHAEQAFKALRTALYRYVLECTL
jgi:beta-barrel assembly-enhancing protease